MKRIKVRQGAWETNSSSTHSLSIAKRGQHFEFHMTFFPNKEGILYLHGGSFGWEWAKYNDAHTKANYCATHCGASSPNSARDMLVSVIKKQLKCKEVVFASDDLGYIDHQSHGTASEAFSSAEKLRRFIFNKNSWLYTGNDNTPPAPNFFDVPEFTPEGVVEAKYTHQLVLDGLPHLDVKFKNVPNEEELSDVLYKTLCNVQLIADGERGLRLNDNSARRFGEFRTPVYYDWKWPDTEVDHVNGRVGLVSEDVFNAAKKVLDRDFKDQFPDWSRGGYQKASQIEKELIASGDPLYIRYLHFKVTEL